MSVRQEHSELWLAVRSVTGCTVGPRLGWAVRQLAARGFTADQVVEFGERYWQLCPRAADVLQARPTPRELVEHIARVRTVPPRRTTAAKKFATGFGGEDE